MTLRATFRSYSWEAASGVNLYCRDDHNLYIVKQLSKPFQIQTAECGLRHMQDFLVQFLGYS